VTLRITGGGAPASLATQAITFSAQDALSPPGDELIASATVTIGAVELVGGDDGPITLTDQGGEFNLMDLQNGVTEALASVEVPPGTYTQLRLVVQSASVTLVDGVTFTDGTSTQSLFVPSGARSGIKIELTDGDDLPGLVVEEGEHIVLLELAVSRNFVLRGPPGAPHSALFTPHVQVVAP
jgi:hypothetical protein